MQASRLFGKYYLITTAIVIAFIVLGVYMSRQLLRLNAPTMTGRHFVFDAKMISDVDPVRRLSSVEKLNAMEGRAHFELVTPDPNLPPTATVATGEPLPDALPKEEFKFQLLEPTVGIIRLSGEPTQFLKVKFEGPNGTRFPWVLIHGLTALTISVLLGIAFAMVIIFRMIEQKVVLADDVIEQLQRGNLKARFDVKRKDEMGRAMLRFNRMADEIERLVEQLRSTEKARVLLLQELAHDLRTPVASLKNLIETVSKPAITPVLRDELFLLSLKEVEYFERLVEDLLILAQVSEPRYDQQQEIVHLDELLKEEVDNLSLAAKTKSPEKKLDIQAAYPPTAAAVRGNPHLLRRMIRNALENAGSFAKEKLTIRLQPEAENLWRITIEDDGPGFAPEILASFGERRISRSLLQSDSKEVRLSVGLGSVILKTVAQVHGGKIAAQNRSSDEIINRNSSSQSPARA